ncbi:biopolymer transporter ExbD [Noviherbaspirillum cavernae]|uniref:Biopolymer transporter ExbD n=1 Tax=Noviherbaspirillum cavernae TaxID=2320862 RepID=A0A418X2E1_9BURK|nr:biopolymer transporter ExbD [Noviherbaspirillum cavernae]RJG06637.1 biopolymer transporter ExbD [Noviherbaspirillum cavernae]
MSFGSPSQDDDMMSEINMTPLVDVMLVLLIIFIITVPVINHAVKIDLPRATSQPSDVKPAHVELAIDAAGAVTWNGTAVEQDVLKARIAEAAAQQPQPELHLRADRQTPYEKVAQVMAAAQSGGLGKIGFITDPNVGR